MDKLEEHIKNNREDLDRHSPSPDAWKKIEKVLKKDKLSLKRWISIAALLVVILGTGLIMFRLGSLSSYSINKVASDVRLPTINPLLKETEIYYINLVKSLYMEATPLLTGNPEIKKELTADISQLDSICLEIKKDLKDNVANQEVVEALIQNYRIKIRLLEDMLFILKENDQKPEKNNNHEL
jgi:hypothetical protein